MPKKNKIIVGLTGGIASGKSAATKAFFELGSHIVDADVISKKVTAPGTCGHARLFELFPKASSEGVIDRSKLRKLVFEDYTELEKLSAAVHPLIAKQAKQEIENVPCGVVVFVVPLLFETGLEKEVDVTVTVSCDEAVRIQRLTKRDNIDKSLALKMLNAQMTDDMRESRSDYIIKNDGSLNDLDKAVKNLYQIFLKKVT